MLIKAVVDRIENGNAYLLSDEAGIEITIPVEAIKVSCNKGETLSITLKNGEMEI